MRKKHIGILVALALSISSLAGICATRQNERVKNGDLVILDQTSGVLPDGRTFVDKMAKTITSKGNTFPVMLHEDVTGNVLVRYYMIQYRTYLVADAPASEKEIALYREYFPKA